MAKVGKNTQTWSHRELSPSLIILVSFLASCSSVSAATWCVNDASKKDDCFTRAPGNDKTGDGTAEKPFRSLERVLKIAQEGDILHFDTGTYSIPAALSKTGGTEPVPIKISNLTLEGAGPERTFFQAKGNAGLVFAECQGIHLREFSVLGGDESLFLNRCDKAELLHIETKHSLSYGILLKDSHGNKIEGCRTSQSRFRGLQLRRSDRNLVHNHLAAENANAGICLEEALENSIQNSVSRQNGMSGFYVYRKSDGNRFEKCVADKNKFVGFYLDNGSTRNRLIKNISGNNERGFTLKAARENDLEQNSASANRGHGFWVKHNSQGGTFKDNLGENNGGAGFIFSNDSPPSLFTQNLSPNNQKPDHLVAVQKLQRSK